MPKSMLRLLLITLGSFAAAFFLTPMLLRGHGDASADDPQRSTSLWLSTEVMEAGEPALAAVTAQITSECATDQRVRIDTFWRDAANQTEVAAGSTWNDRTTSGTLGVQWQYPQAEFGSGTTFRAQFTAYGPGGAVTFTFSRSLVLP